MKEEKKKLEQETLKRQFKHPPPGIQAILNLLLMSKGKEC